MLHANHVPINISKRIGQSGTCLLWMWEMQGYVIEILAMEGVSIPKTKDAEQAKYLINIPELRTIPGVLWHSVSEHVERSLIFRGHACQ